MGSSLAASSKLMYYPTNFFETYRLLGLLGRIEIPHFKKRYLEESDLFTKEQWIEFKGKVLDNNIDLSYVLYDYWLNTNQYDMIKMYCTYEIGLKNDNHVTICDPFAGEAEWLNTFKTFIPLYDRCNDFLLIANELEENRYNSFISNQNINDKYNNSFEELQLPKNSVSLMLYNPPYGSTNGVRNVRHYLKMILDRQLLYNPEQSSDYKAGYMVFVIRKDDFLDSLDLIVKHFDVYKHCIYKTNPDEYSKFKQYIFITRIRRHPYDLNKSRDAMDFQEQYNTIKNIIESEPEFKLSMYESIKPNYPNINYSNLKENLKYIETSENYISKNDSVWKWIKDITKISDMGTEKIEVPRQLKIGEMANIISSGYINGEISLNGEAKHIAVGGTKKVEKQELNTYIGEDGKKVKETKVIRMSQPYLNILVSENGKLKIKELAGGE